MTGHYPKNSLEIQAKFLQNKRHYAVSKVHLVRRRPFMKTAALCLNVVCCFFIVIFAGCSQSDLQGKDLPVMEKRDNFRWPDGKRAAISLTFDDARHSQITNGVPILDEYGTKATFYVSIPNLDRGLDAWKAAAANGHEIGNHTLTHPCSGNFPFIGDRALEDYNLDRMRHELTESNATIERLLDVRPVSFAYPCGQKYVGRGRNLKSYVPLVAEAFWTGRGWMDEWANDPAFCDTAQLMAMELDGKDFEQVKQVIDRTLANGGWLVFCGHEIAEDGRQTTRSSTLKALCEYAQDPANGLWLDTVEAITRHIRKQRTGKAG
ncbi:MAG: polysaccharide deacetylase [Planctomycetes bacterium B3_Pla]|nr:MAG: polysaccharide deacetylase [Planctomycetes bacterium B3_Pla]